jgi:hypothetical protein
MCRIAEQTWKFCHHHENKYSRYKFSDFSGGMVETVVILGCYVV